MLHLFEEKQIKGIELPRKFTWPFHYSPHPLCQTAAIETQRHIARQEEWQEELRKGKMFGVLVVCDNDNRLGYLAAFSGNLAGSNFHDYFVPPIYDALQPDGFFKIGEAEISKINYKITELESSEKLQNAQKRLATISLEAQKLITQAKEQLSLNKQLRNKRRLDGTDETILIAESQHEKAEFNRLKKRLNEAISIAQEELNIIITEIERLKEERKSRSAQLQLKLFAEYRLLNGRGETKGICEIFAEARNELPPAGTGECAAPKLLQYAYQQGLRPIAMAEFWWGDSPKGEIRRHGNFYPSCIGKCHPTLLYMMQGLDVEDNPLENAKRYEPEILWEDEHIVVINKPSGMLSVRGKVDGLSAEQWAQELYPGAKMAHRLDQATSGIVVIAKDNVSYLSLQKQFISRRVKKSYVALLDGTIANKSGEINLPLKLDYDNRPRQMVATDGKTAITRYEVMAYEENKTRVKFYPITGRTHQLRVHAAHQDGLATPIVGDELYGTPNKRLYLHAESIEFTHPITKKTIQIHCQPDF